MGTQKVNKTAGAVKCRSEKPFWSVGSGTRAGERLPRGWRGGGRWETKSHPRSARSARPAERPARCGHGARRASERPGPCAAAALPALDEKAAGTRARIGKGPLCRGTAPELYSADRGSQTQRHSAPAGNVATASKEEGEGEGQPCTAARVLAGRDALDPWWRCSRLSKKARTQDFHVKSLNPFDGRLRWATLCCAVTTGRPRRPVL